MAISEQDKNSIYSLHSVGLTTTEISNELGLPFTTVRGVLRRSGKRSNSKSIPLSTLLSLFEEGKTVGEIAKAVNLNHSSVSERLIKAGIKTRNPKPIDEILTEQRQGKTLTEIAKESGVSVNTVSQRLIRRGVYTEVSRTKNIESRLIEKRSIDSNTGCWNWTGQSVTNKGYGRISINNRQQAVHRVSYATFVGEITNDLHVRHKCDNPSCFNPEHLELGTHQDNMEDRTKRGRQGKCPRWLSSEKNDEIIRLRSQGVSSREVAERLEIARTTVDQRWLKYRKNKGDAYRMRKVSRTSL